MKEGKWDKFIDVWYTEPMTPTVGHWCNYTPPSLVISGTVESMTLQIDAITEETVKLTWSEVPDASLGDYLVHARQPGDVSWAQIASLPAPEITYELAIRSDERHRFIVVAASVDGEIIAKSETSDWQGDSGTQQVYLPLISR